MLFELSQKVSPRYGGGFSSYILRVMDTFDKLKAIRADSRWAKEESKARKERVYKPQVKLDPKVRVKLSKEISDFYKNKKQ